jgi:enoyl-CoA hydratase/carnithine racemase
MTEIRQAAPWPDVPFLVDLDAVKGSPTDGIDLAGIEGAAGLSIGFARGACAGAALAAAVVVDLVVAGPAATFGRPGEWTEIVVRRGLGIVGAKAIGYLAMTGRSIDGTTAQAWGLVNAVDSDPEATARRLADVVARRSPVAVAAIRRQAHAGASADHLIERARRIVTSAASAAATAP